MASDSSPTLPPALWRSPVYLLLGMCGLECQNHWTGRMLGRQRWTQTQADLLGSLACICLTDIDCKCLLCFLNVRAVLVLWDALNS